MKDQEIDEQENDDGYPVHTIAQRFEDFGCEDCDESADLLLMLLDGFNLPPECPVSTLIVVLLKHSKQWLHEWIESENEKRKTGTAQ